MGSRQELSAAIKQLKVCHFALAVVMEPVSITSTSGVLATINHLPHAHCTCLSPRTMCACQSFHLILNSLLCCASMPPTQTSMLAAVVLGSPEAAMNPELAAKAGSMPTSPTSSPQLMLR